MKKLTLEDYYLAQEELRAMAERDPKNRGKLMEASEAATLIADAVQGSDWDYPSCEALRMVADHMEGKMKDAEKEEA